MKTELSLIKSKCLTYVLAGIGWLFYGVLSIFDNLVCSLLASVVLLVCVSMSIKSQNVACEPDDEMSEYDLIKAKAHTMDWLQKIMCIVFLLFSIVGILHEFLPDIQAKLNISLKIIISAILGITEISIGLLFVKYEKDGE